MGLFIALPGGRLKKLRNRRGGPKAEKNRSELWFDEPRLRQNQWQATTEPIKEAVSEPTSIGIAAASYNGNGKILLRLGDGKTITIKI